MELANKLAEFGLKPEEAKVYLALIELGTSSVLNIAKKSSLKRTTIYDILELLKDKGLINEVFEGKKRYFQGREPEYLLNTWKNKEKQLTQLLPELTSVYNLSDIKPKVKYYEGLENTKALYEQILKEKQDYYVISENVYFFNLDPDFFYNFLKRRARLKINVKLILTRNERAEWQKKHEKEQNVIIKFFPKQYYFLENLLIFPNKIIIHTQTKEAGIMAIVIEYTNIAKSMQAMFEFMWNFAEKE